MKIGLKPGLSLHIGSGEKELDLPAYRQQRIHFLILSSIFIHLGSLMFFKTIYTLPSEEICYMLFSVLVHIVVHGV